MSTSYWNPYINYYVSSSTADVYVHVKGELKYEADAQRNPVMVIAPGVYFKDMNDKVLEFVPFDGNSGEYIKKITEMQNKYGFTSYYKFESITNLMKVKQQLRAKKDSQHNQNNSRNDEEKSSRQTEQNNDNLTSSLFVGCTDLESLKKRYYQLMKIYHPDNQNGNELMSKKVQDEYEKMKKRCENN